MNNGTLNSGLLATLILVWTCIAGCAANEKKLVETDEDGFVSIFDGKTLKGWRALPPETAPAWTVTDGMIVGDGDKGRGYLTFENGDIADLELKLSYRFPDKGNSGISIRAREDKTGRRHFQAYHADLGHVGIDKQVLGAWDFHTPGRREHACFRGDRLVIDEEDNPVVTKIEGAVTTEDINKGDWNTVHVIAKGNNFKFFINGKLSSEFTEKLPNEKRLHRGMIQLQLHDPGMIVHFKDIRLKILK
ncbi:MAG: hypothetical protein AMJ65_09325 [Phycisphaerae bacterium SG8_4]|nr:MAG: hypothetical protein AMJ65_09325 [Phycisphaerae bacterium SG8_4]